MGEVNPKLEYVKSLDEDGVRYELDKILARLRQIEILRGLRAELTDKEIFQSELNILDEDYQLLTEEYDLYSYYYDELRRTNG